ncbi:alpha/beta hydrolase [Antrihabitans sp. YC2-6]|uniref:alpha/beta hydrolase n=1 Tax=Antrihabitans sp. YC2-6 TaxID=2799498 RepID=UPI001F185EC2|nr:alpha/beta hydrolase [Antrihabitans sp. YC2-6]
MAIAGCAAHAVESGRAIPEATDLQTFYGQTISWSECHDGKECGRLAVPLDYADPGERTIEIAVVRKPADDPDIRVGTLVYNPGGPGASGVEAVAMTSDILFSPTVNQRYDLVGFDPRGVGESTAVECLSDEEIDAAASVDPTPETAAEVEALVAHSEKTAAACRANSPDGLLDHMSTVEVARDLDILRAALGEEKLSYLGVSYGTYLGAIYAEHFVDKVGRFVLDGATDPREWPFAPGYTATKSASFQLALDSFVADCVTQADCPVGADPVVAQQLLVDLVAKTDRTPLPGDGDRKTSESTLLNGFAVALFAPELWSVLRTAIADAQAGDGELFLALSDAISGRDENGHYSSLGDVVGIVDCLDGPPEFAVDEVADALPELRELSPIFAPLFAWSATCTGMPAAKGEPHEIQAPGAPPIVVVGTTRDPATPYRWAEGLAEQLQSGVLVTYDGDGHGAYGSDRNQCIVDTVDAYLVDGAVPETGSWCTDAG